jgi:hypothetical protein
MIATERLYLTSDCKKVVKEGDIKAAFLLCAKGRQIPSKYEHLMRKEKDKGSDKEVTFENKAKTTKKKTVKFGG